MHNGLVFSVNIRKYYQRIYVNKYCISKTIIKKINITICVKYIIYFHFKFLGSESRSTSRFLLITFFFTYNAT